MTESPFVPTWRKSSYSGQQGGDCVEAAPMAGAVGVRDSKNVQRGHVAMRRDAWAALTAALKR